MARNSELVKSQIRDQQATTLDAVSTHRFSARRQTGRGKGGNSYNTTRKATQYDQRMDKCGRCNRRHGDHGACPAMGQKCRKCSRMNHFAVCCRVTTV